MNNSLERYNPTAVESRWQKRWEDDKVFEVTEDPDKEKYYLLEMFPYPSGRIHMGHVRNYSIGDVAARIKRMSGYNVLHPMGWDAFGMPAENAAIANNTHPAKWTYENIAYMTEQLKGLGLSYDWTRELATCDPSYYRWEQLVFLEMWEKGLVYRKRSLVNWCESCQTVLANEQVVNGLCWRCNNEPQQKRLDGYFFKITDYVEELLEWTDKLDGWPERVLTMQRNWIGKSYGAEIHFPILERGGVLKVFTTRADTIHGATFMSLAPEHPLALELSAGGEQEQAVKDFVDRVRRQSLADRADEKLKEGVFTGAYCENPMTGLKMPVYVANFVLMDYGTGAVMAVPTHDQRDFEFAGAYNLPLAEVIVGPDGPVGVENMTEAFTDRGTLINSGPFDGMNSKEGMRAIAAELKKRGLGSETVNYRLRDWGISRQRYWGTPIPMVHCDKCGLVPVKEADLPVELPLDAQLPETGGSPLPGLDAWVNVDCPSCGAPAKRETDTMDTFVESSWYFDRYACPDHDEAMFDQERVDHWMPVDQYIGGIEHAILHLLYARYWTKILRDLGYIKVDEPFKRLLTQGMVLRNLWECPTHGPLKGDKIIAAESGLPPKCKLCDSPLTATGPKEKMSKSKGNTLDPEDLVDLYGADTVRIFYLFTAPPEKEMDWSDEGIQGAQRFLNRVWRLIVGNLDPLEKTPAELDPGVLEGRLKKLYRKLNLTIRKVTDEIEERWHFNTAVAAIMELVNETYLALADDEAKADPSFKPLLRKISETLIRLLSPMVPHITDELHARLGGQGFLLEQPWPDYDPEAIKAEEITIVLQVNGKVRAQIEVPADITKEELENITLKNERVLKFRGDKPIRKLVVVPGRLVNVVV